MVGAGAGLRGGSGIFQRPYRRALARSRRRRHLDDRIHLGRRCAPDPREPGRRRAGGLREHRRRLGLRTLAAKRARGDGPRCRRNLAADHAEFRSARLLISTPRGAIPSPLFRSGVNVRRARTIAYVFRRNRLRGWRDGADDDLRTGIGARWKGGPTTRSPAASRPRSSSAGSAPRAGGRGGLIGPVIAAVLLTPLLSRTGGPPMKSPSGTFTIS